MRLCRVLLPGLLAMAAAGLPQAAVALDAAEARHLLARSGFTAEARTSKPWRKNHGAKPWRG